MTIDGVAYSIPLSRGINVIIGDNSIGKSLLLHELTGYKKQQEGLIKKKLVDGYKKYLKRNNIEIMTEIPSAEIFAFDMQGEIRDKFEQEKLKSDDFLKPYYPVAFKPLDTMQAQLGRFRIFDEDVVQAESLIFVGAVAKNNKRVEGYNVISSDLDNVVEKLETIMDSQWLDPEDQKQLDYIVEELDSMAMRYTQKKKAAEFENKKIALFQAAINKFKQQYQASVSDSHK